MTRILNRPPKTGYFFRQLLWSTLLVVLPVVALAGFLEFRQTMDMAERLQQSGIAYADEAARVAQLELKRINGVLNFLQAREEVRKLDTPACNGLLAGFQGMNLMMRNVLVLGTQGELLCAARTWPNMPGNFKGLPWYQEAMEAEGRRYSQPYKNPESGGASVVLTDFLSNRSGHVIGLVGVVLDVNRFSREILRSEGLPDGSVLALLDAEDRLLARTSNIDEFFGKKVQLLSHRAQQKAGHVERFAGVDGVERAYTWADVETTGWHVFAGIPVRHLHDAGKANAMAALLVLVVPLAACLCVAWWNARRLAAPAQNLANVAKRLGEGDRSVRADPWLPGEFGHLAVEFNSMLNSLATSQAEEKLANERFGRIFDALPVPAALHSQATGLLVQVNDAFCETYGLARRELLGRTLQSYGLGLSSEDYSSYHDCIAKHGRIRNVVATVRVKERELRQVLACAETVTLNGRPHLLSIHIDITDRLNAETELRKHMQQLRAVVNGASDGIVTVDASLRVVVFNDAAAKMFGVPATEALGSSPERFVPPYLRQALRRELERSIGRRDEGERAKPLRRFKALRANGEKFPVEVTFAGAGEGPRATLTAIIRDVTQREQTRRTTLDHARMRAANEAKSRFLARTSHELRTPLNAVLGFARLLQESLRNQLDARQARQLELIQQAGSQLLALINDVLDLSRIEVGQLAVQMQEVDLQREVDDALQMSLAEAEAAGVSLLKEPVMEGTPRVHSDPTRLQQVLLNLLSNGIKYNRKGGEVRVSIHQVNGDVELVVADNGMGMSAEQLAQVYEPFNRLGRESTGVPGTGIGMALTRELMGLLKGRIRVDSKEGEGTVVTLSMPATTSLPAVAKDERSRETDPAPPVEALAETQSQVEGTILYIEDLPINVFLVESLLAPLKKVKVVVAGDGESGIRMAKELMPNFILLDMHLPDMTGVDVLNALRSDETTRDLPVVALSANAMPNDIHRARAAGANDYWTKPLNFERFQEGVLHWLTR